MFSMFRKNRLDLSTPSKFEKSIIEASDDLDDLFGPKTWQEIGKKQNPRAYMEVVESLALSGNSKCQELVAQWSIMVIDGSENPENLKFGLRKAVRFGQLAAQSGVAREAVNLPISMMKLAGILMEESGGYFTEEIEELFKGTYQWSLINSKNLQLSKADRESAAELAAELYEGSPELFDSKPEIQEEENQSEPVLHGQKCAKDICNEVEELDVILQQSGFPTISLLNRLISAGADREFVAAVSAIWFVQASNDPNTRESQKIAGGIIGTLENFFVEEARAIDADVFKLFTRTINNNEYGALFEEPQPIYAAGRKEVNEKFPPGSTAIEDIYSHYANVMLNTTKQNKEILLNTLQALAGYVDNMCGLANQAEKDLF